jgi:CheY-like chemotaxis protein
MKIFVLEDDENRINFFQSKLSKKVEKLVIADNVQEAKIILSHFNFDILFLDHDLGEPFTEENTGAGLAKFIVKKSIKCKEIYIHSMSTVGAQNIKNILDDADYDSFKIPFCYLSKELPIILENR